MINQATQRRISLLIQGTVQGVGFRPFVHRLAMELKLAGGVRNTLDGVIVDLEGVEPVLSEFLHRLRQELPPHAAIRTIEQRSLPPQGATDFEIWVSEATSDAGLALASVLPDLRACPNCLQETHSSRDRRYRYPFTNCTHCGPRFSIITALPYDRRHTTMADFALCPDCQAEYTNPSDRRFHAQPNACPRCGPALAFWVDGHRQQGDPLQQAIALLRQGNILALKGLGGFQLLADAQNPEAVARLRQRKRRPSKPLALMYPDLQHVRRHCQVSPAAADLLASAQAPIVLLPKLTCNIACTELAAAIAPGNPDLGVMLPTTPLHQLLLHQYCAPLVATSGNVSGNPICTQEQEAFRQLEAIADGFLMHNRPIQRPVDDSVVQIAQGQPQVLRHARGYAPQVIPLPSGLKAAEHRVLAVGAHLKSAIALSLGDQIVLGQHIGDLETPKAVSRLRQAITDWLALYQCQPTAIACDLHPDYSSTHLAQSLAEQWSVPLIPIQHHYAHALSGIAEHQLHGPVLAIAWDGTGYGTDQTIWGGEFLQVTDSGFERMAHLRPFPLPGGDACSREPWRSAVGLLYTCYGEAAFELDLAPLRTLNPSQRTVLRQMLARQINAPMTSSMGRLFDGVAALLDIYQTVSFEGQAAMALEFAADKDGLQQWYPFTITESQPHIIDWTTMLRAIVTDVNSGISPSLIAARFHRTLGEIAAAIAHHAGAAQVLFTGGCFQNRLLSEQTQQLTSDGFTVYHHQRVPLNDGGIAVGQALGALRYLSQE